MRFPRFAIIGGARCGTAWLRWYLDLHPEILMLAGEPDWFAEIAGRSPVIALEKLLPHPSNFHRPAEFSNELYERCVIGAKNPALHRLPIDQIEKMRTLLPETKVILVVRDPVERTWSYVKHKFQNEPYFEEFLGTNSYADLSKQAKWIWMWTEREIANRQLSESIIKWQEIYPDDQFGIFQFEDITRTPAHFLTTMFEFIGVTTAVDWRAFAGYETRRNFSLRSQIPADFEKYLEKRLREERQNLAAILETRSTINRR